MYDHQRPDVDPFYSGTADGVKSPDFVNQGDARVLGAVVRTVYPDGRRVVESITVDPGFVGSVSPDDLLTARFGGREL